MKAILHVLFVSLLASPEILCVTANPSLTQEAKGTGPDIESEENETAAVVAVNEQPMSEGDARLKEQLKRELKEELLQSLRGSNNEEVQSYSRPCHYHHYHHHHHRQRELTADVAASGTILAQELLALKALLQATENKLQMTETRLQAVENRQHDEQDEPQATRENKPHSCEDKSIDTHERLEAAERKVAQFLDRSADAQIVNGTLGSMFVRWGRTTCPENTQLVYSGYAGGAGWTNSGSGANRICLTDQPVFDDHTMTFGGHGNLHGAQYWVQGHQTTDVLCVLCHTPFSATFMVPGTNRCPQESTMQYHGHLAVGDYAHKAPSEYVCLDAQPEDRPGSQADEEGAWFDQAIVVCGSLPCPPYISGRVTTCAVCSK